MQLLRASACQLHSNSSSLSPFSSPFSEHAPRPATMKTDDRTGDASSEEDADVASDSATDSGAKDDATSADVGSSNPDPNVCQRTLSFSSDPNVRSCVHREATRRETNQCRDVSLCRWGCHRNVSRHQVCWQGFRKAADAHGERVFPISIVCLGLRGSYHRRHRWDRRQNTPIATKPRPLGVSPRNSAPQTAKGQSASSARTDTSRGPRDYRQ